MGGGGAIGGTDAEARRILVGRKERGASGVVEVREGDVKDGARLAGRWLSRGKTATRGGGINIWRS